MRNLLGWKLTDPLHQNSVDEQCNYLLTNFIDIKQHENAYLNEIVESFSKIKESGKTSKITKGSFSSKLTKQLQFMKKAFKMMEIVTKLICFGKKA